MAVIGTFRWSLYTLDASSDNIPRQIYYEEIDWKIEAERSAIKINSTHALTAPPSSKLDSGNVYFFSNRQTMILARPGIRCKESNPIKQM